MRAVRHTNPLNVLQVYLAIAPGDGGALNLAGLIQLTIGAGEAAVYTQRYWPLTCCTWYHAVGGQVGNGFEWTSVRRV